MLCDYHVGTSQIQVRQLLRSPAMLKNDRPWCRSREAKGLKAVLVGRAAGFLVALIASERRARFARRVGPIVPTSAKKVGRGFYYRRRTFRNVLGRFCVPLESPKSPRFLGFSRRFVARRKIAG